METTRLAAFDLHCDTLMTLREGQTLDQPGRMVTLPGLETAGAMVQCFAIFVPVGRLPAENRQAAADGLYDLYHEAFTRTLAAFGDRLRQVRTVAEAEECRRRGLVGAMLTLEDAGMLGGDPARLDRAWRHGARIASLTWNHENALAFPNSPDPEIMDRGLKPAGFAFLEQCQSLGVACDVSHLSDGGFWDLARVMKKPFLASHSNARAVCDHPRNLTDEMIRTLADRGGVMGLNLCPRFLAEGEEHSRISDMVRHVKHILAVGGEDVPALGSDFDGIRGDLEVGGPEDFPRLADALLAAGVTPRQLEKMWCANALRVLGDVQSTH